MRKITMLYALICLAFIAYGQNGEEENVIKAIKAKSDASQSRDIEAWKASWKHDATSSLTFISRDGYFVVSSWDSLSAFMERNIRQNPNPDNTVQTKLDNFSVHTDGNLATAEYDAILTPATDQSSIFPYTGVERHRDYEVLVKEDGKWKTSTELITLPGSYDVNSHTAETDLNTAGYDLLAAKKIKEAIEVFKMNVKLFPDSWNVYDSLGEAYAADGNKKDAIANYEKSIQLNPNNDSGKETLAKLKQK
jgi:tetratricopeptide (TPR) repeat protein